jgi:hypothetical protein
LESSQTGREPILKTSKRSTRPSSILKTKISKYFTEITL